MTRMLWMRRLLAAVRRPGRSASRRLRATRAGAAVAARQREINARWRAHVLAHGDPAPDPPPGGLLVIAPHPDDETIGCAGTIARRRAAGCAVDVVVVSDGGTSHHSQRLSAEEIGARRRQESLTACALLGVPEDRVHFLGFTEAGLRADHGDLRRRLRDALERLRPAEVLVVAREDWHPEHRLVHDATVEAAESLGFEGELFAYPVWHWDNGPSIRHPGGSLLGHALDALRSDRLIERTPRARLTPLEGLVDLKRQAFEKYETQTTNFTGEPGWQPFPAGWLDKFLDQFEVAFPVRRRDATRSSVRLATRREAR